MPTDSMTATVKLKNASSRAVRSTASRAARLCRANFRC